MPTLRAIVILVLALALYLVANQTQVGWVYIMVDLLAALLLAAFLFSRGGLRGLSVQRGFGGQNPPPADDLSPPDFFEDDPISVTVTISQTGRRPVFMLAGADTCPFAPPADRQQTFFIPTLFKHGPATLQYHTTCHQRGVFSFSPLHLKSGGPFGLFRSRRKLPAPDELLVYPQYVPLKRFRLLENRGFTDRHAQRVGISSEVIGTREYRAGDSLRQIHWRSTARVGRLVVKEFTDQDHLSLTVVLDLSADGSVGRGKHSTFETAVRLAASLGYYATHHNVPFRLAGHSQRWQPPDIALSWWGVLHYLARVQNDGNRPLAHVLRTLPPPPFVVALVSRPTAAVTRELVALSKRGSEVLAIFITPDNAPPPALPGPGSGSITAKMISPNNWQEAVKSIFN
jgi:uncharacterized protein (DUF58 family)